MTTIHDHKLPTGKWAVKGSNYLKKKKFISENTFPTYDDVIKNLGTPLAEIVLGQLPLVTEESIGVQLSGKDQTASDVKMVNLLKSDIKGNELSTREQLLQEYIRQGGMGKTMPMKKKSTDDELESKIEPKYDIKDEYIQEKITKAILETRNEAKDNHFREMHAALNRQEVYFNDLIKSFEEKQTISLEKAKEEAVKTVTDSAEDEIKHMVKLKEKKMEEKFRFQLEWLKFDLEEKCSMKMRNYQLNLMKLLKDAENTSKKKLKEIKSELTLRYHKKLIGRNQEEVKQFSKVLTVARDEYAQEILDLQKQISDCKDKFDQEKKKNKETERKLQTSLVFLRQLVNECEKLAEPIFKEESNQGGYLISLEKLLSEINKIEEKEVLIEEPKEKNILEIMEVDPVSCDLLKVITEDHLSEIEENEKLKFIQQYILYLIKTSLPSPEGSGQDINDTKYSLSDITSDLSSQNLDAEPKLSIYDFKVSNSKSSSDDFKVSNSKSSIDGFKVSNSKSSIDDFKVSNSKSSIDDFKVSN